MLGCRTPTKAKLHPIFHPTHPRNVKDRDNMKVVRPTRARHQHRNVDCTHLQLESCNYHNNIKTTPTSTGVRLRIARSAIIFHYHHHHHQYQFASLCRRHRRHCRPAGMLACRAAAVRKEQLVVLLRFALAQITTSLGRVVAL